MRRFLAALLFLFGLTAPALAFNAGQAGLISQGYAWNQPALTAGGYGLGGVRFHFPDSVGASATSLNRFQVMRMHSVTPPWASMTSDWIVGWANMALSGNNTTTGSETQALNPLTMNWATFCLDEPLCLAGAWPASCNGALGATITNDFSSNVLTCRVPGWHPPPSTDYWIINEVSVLTSQRIPTGYFFDLQGDDMGEVRQSFSADQPSLRLGGAISGSQTGNSLAYGPSFILVSGYDGSGDHGIIGTSRAYAMNEYDFKLATKGATGAIERGLSSDTNGYKSTGNFSAPGAYTAHAVGAGMRVRRGIFLNALNFPIDWIDTDDNVNDINNGGGPPSLAGIQKLDYNFWIYWHGICPTCGINHYFGEPWANSTLNFSLWSNVPDQIPNATAALPNGLQWQVNSWLGSGVGIPSYVHPINYGPAFQDSVQTDHWSAPSISGTLTTDCSMGSRSCVYSLNAVPGEGDAMVMDLNNSNAENILISKVTCTGSGPFSCTILYGASTARAHLAASLAAIGWNHDGVHQLTTPSKAGGVIVAAHK